MSEFLDFAKGLQADLFGSPEKSKAQAEKQAELEHKRVQAEKANNREAAGMRLFDAGIPSEVEAVVRRVIRDGVDDPTWEYPDPIPQAMRAVTEGPTRLVVLLGPPGEGKSVAAGFALTHALELGRQGLWRTGVQLAKELRSWDKADVRVRHRAEQVDILVVDDLGLESARNPSVAPALAGLLLSRFEANRATIVTSNIRSPQELKQRYGAQVYDRLRTKGGLLFLCNGKDYRKKC
jgi:hypothetical protein